MIPFWPGLNPADRSRQAMYEPLRIRHAHHASRGPEFALEMNNDPEALSGSSADRVPDANARQGGAFGVHDWAPIGCAFAPDDPCG